MRTILTALVTFGACTTLRRKVEQAEPVQQDFAGGRVRLETLWNEDGPFGVKVPGEVLLSLSGAVLGTVLATRKRSPVAAGLMLGGGLSNFAERLLYGKVCDYVRFPKAPGRLKRYVFNLADFAIFLGGIAWAPGKKK